jgi:hypothetical protein
MKFNRTSINELNALVNRACEAYLGNENDFEEVASKIIWLEVNDFGGIRRFIDLTSNEMRNLNNRPELLDNKKEVIFNNNNKSLILSSHFITDITLSNWYDDKRKNIKIINARDPEALIPDLLKFTKYQFEPIFIWYSEKKLYKVHIRKNEDILYSEHKIPSLSSNDLENYIMLCSNQEDLEKYQFNPDFLEVKDKNIIQEIHPENFSAKENDKLINGLYIDKEAFKTMSKLADQVLVASNEQSRQGAGE